MKSRIIWSLFFLMCVGMVASVSRSLFWSYPLKDSPNVLIITLDTTRADHLGCYGYNTIKTPHIDSVAREGVLFENAFSVQPLTLPSHCSIFTGNYPFNHGVRDNSIYRLGENNHTLAEILKKKGYLTAAFIACFVLDRQFGLNQGFSLYNDPFLNQLQMKDSVERRAAEISRYSCNWLDANKKKLAKRPFFLWLHYFDPHANHDPPSPYREEYSNPYDGEIAYMDEWIGYVLDKLKDMELWDNTVILLVGDHGESLGEHDEQTHGLFIYRSTTHVPLIIKLPKGAHGGERITQQASIVDIMPTILDLLHINTEIIFDGQSLLPLVEKTDWDNKRPIYVESFHPRHFNWSEIMGIRKGKYFFIEAPRPELYSHNEFDNLINVHPGIAKGMKSTIATMLAGTPKASSEHVSVDEETTKKLEALGYFVAENQKTMAEDTGTLRPDPKDKVKVFNLYNVQAYRPNEKGLHKLSTEFLEKIIAQDPNNPAFLIKLGLILKEQKNYTEAEKHLIRALSIAKKDVNCYYSLGLCYEEWGKPDKAIEAYVKALALNQEHFPTLFNLGLLHLKAERWSKAKETFLKARRIRPYDAQILFNLAHIAIDGRKDLQTGIDLIEQALKTDPKNPSALGSLGGIYYYMKKYKKAAKHFEAALALVPDNKQFIKQLKAVYEALGDKAKLNMLENRENILKSKEGTDAFPAKMLD